MGTKGEPESFVDIVALLLQYSLARKTAAKEDCFLKAHIDKQLVIISDGLVSFVPIGQANTEQVKANTR